MWVICHYCMHGLADERTQLLAHAGGDPQKSARSFTPSEAADAGPLTILVMPDSTCGGRGGEHTVGGGDVSNVRGL